MTIYCGRIKISMAKENILKMLLSLVLGLALFLRIYNLPSPPSLNWDEVSHGYNAYSILKTGRDEWGIKLPLIFRAYGDYKLPLYIYLTTFFVAIGGLLPLTVRLVSVLSGIGLVVLTFLITQKIVKDKMVSLVAALLTAVSPWSLFLSRVAVEANLGAFLFALGMYFLVELEEKPRKYLILAALFWGLSLYAYNSARVLVPIFALLTPLWLKTKLIKKEAFKYCLLAGAILLIFFIPVIGQFLDKSGSARFDLVSLVDQGTINDIIQARQKTHLPPVLARIIYNRPAYFVSAAIKNYFSNLSPKYLFFRGGSHYQFSLPDHELLYLVTAPLLLLGLILVFWKGRRGEKLVGWWFLLGFIPSAITRDAPHVLRSIFVLPTPMVLTGLGLKWIGDKIGKSSFFKGYLLIGVFCLAVTVSFARWWQDYQKIYPVYYSWAWQYGYKEAVEFVKENYKNYDQIFFTKRYGEPHEFVLFFFPWDPRAYQVGKKWGYHANWYWVDGFDKFVFVNDWEVVGGVECGVRGKKCLLITSPGNYPEGWKRIKTVTFLDGKQAFEILELKSD